MDTTTRHPAREHADRRPRTAAATARSRGILAGLVCGTGAALALASIEPPGDANKLAVPFVLSAAVSVLAWLWSSKKWDRLNGELLRRGNLYGELIRLHDPDMSKTRAPYDLGAWAALLSCLASLAAAAVVQFVSDARWMTAPVGAVAAFFLAWTASSAVALASLGRVHESNMAEIEEMLDASNPRRRSLRARCTRRVVTRQTPSWQRYPG